METAGQNTKQVMEENDALKQFMELLNQQNMKEQSQDFMGAFWYVAGMQVQLTASKMCNIHYTWRCIYGKKKEN